MPAATIPTEIWELIFRSATSIPAPMIPPLENFYYHYFAADLGERRARRALETKWRLAKVSKQWRNIMLPLLFEHTILKDFGSLDALVKSLDKPVLDNTISQGELVRRLDIVARNDQDDIEGILHLFSKMSHLFTLLPNLKVLVFHNSFKVNSNKLLSGTQSLFLNSVSNSLESIVWIDDDRNWTLLKIPSLRWASFLNEHPNLKSIHPPLLALEDEVLWSIQDEEAVTPLLKPLDKVTQLLMRPSCITHTDPIFLPGSTHGTQDSEDMFPNLRHVTFEFGILGPLTMEMLGGIVPTPSLLEHHGHKLTSLNCAFNKTADQDFLEYNDFPPQTQFFPMIARYCINLEELGLFFNWKSGPSTYIGGTTLPTVKRLKIRRMNRRFRAGSFRIMLNFVAETAVLRLPNLAEVVFMSERDVGYIQRFKKELREELMCIQRRVVQESGVRILDWEGNTLDFS